MRKAVRGRHMTLSERPCRLTAGARKPVGVALLSLTSLVARDEGSDEHAMRCRIERCQTLLDKLIWLYEWQRLTVENHATPERQEAATAVDLLLLDWP